MLHFLAMGVILGLSAGAAPGPLLALVITETLQHDIKSGVKVAIAPIITDLPIIILTLFILSKLSGFHNILGIISIAGGIFVFFMGYESICTKGYEFDFQDTKPRSLTKGILTNALSPHPYLFWLSVGAPAMTRAMGETMFAAWFFIGGFYVFLVGTKILLAFLAGHSKSFLRGNAYIYIMRFLGLALCLLAVFLFFDGLKLLKLIKA